MCAQASGLLSVQFYEVDLPPVSEKKIKLVNAVIPDEKRVSTLRVLHCCVPFCIAKSSMVSEKKTQASDALEPD